MKQKFRCTVELDRSCLIRCRTSRFALNKLGGKNTVLDQNFIGGNLVLKKLDSSCTDLSKRHRHRGKCGRAVLAGVYVIEADHADIARDT